MSKVVTIGIVDDSRDLRENIGGYLGAFPEFRCTHAYATAREALAGLPKNPPDVVLMDINLGERATDGIECVRALKVLLPEILVLMLTVFDDSEKIFQALAAGASGYLLKRQRPEELLAAIREVVAGGAPMSTSIARKVVKSFQSAPRAGAESTELSNRELEVLKAMAEGLAYKQIADQLNVSIHTVRNYIRRIYEKLHVHSRTAAVVKFLKT
ncbi:MAG TPA: response regulator transcription factor [Verrucomicrobiae bacterium]|jgi:DNA-binding NarL/FixJ family response regulator|nr:response regulator transcription factor [Verrucomicrobiae bacterium]